MSEPKQLIWTYFVQTFFVAPEIREILSILKFSCSCFPVVLHPFKASISAFAACRRQKDHARFEDKPKVVRHEGGRGLLLQRAYLGRRVYPEICHRRWLLLEGG